MATDLTIVPDHPAALLQEWKDTLPVDHSERPGGLRAIEILRAHERLQGVTFAALDNDGLKAVREAYRQMEHLTRAEYHSQWMTAQADFQRAVRDLLGLD